MAADNIIQIPDTPLGISVYQVKDKPLNMHDAGTLEIIFCLEGTVGFAYAYEEFTLNAGEFVSVDRDAYYLYSDGYNMCSYSIHHSLYSMYSKIRYRRRFRNIV